jgi:hypothetical protein
MTLADLKLQPAVTGKLDGIAVLYILVDPVVQRAFYGKVKGRV